MDQQNQDQEAIRIADDLKYEQLKESGALQAYTDHIALQRQLNDFLCP